MPSAMLAITTLLERAIVHESSRVKLRLNNRGGPRTLHSLTRTYGHRMRDSVSDANDMQNMEELYPHPNLMLSLRILLCYCLSLFFLL